MLILFSGVPGSGKSSLALAVARHYQIPLYGRDILSQFLYQRHLITDNTIDSYLLMFTLAEQNMRLGIGAILDGTYPKREFRQQAQALADSYDMPFKAVWCKISDRNLWRERWHQRQQAGSSSHWMDFTWNDVLAIERRFEAWEGKQALVVDAVQPFDENFKRVLAYVSI